MNDQQNRTNPADNAFRSTSAQLPTELNFLDYSRRIWQERNKVVRNVFIAGVLSVILALILPKTFKASSVLMPPRQTQTSSLMNSLSSFPLSGLLGQSTDETLSFLAILKSRTVMTNVVRKFDLVSRYEVENEEEAIRALINNVDFLLEDEGTIRVSAFAGTSWFHPDAEEDSARVLCTEMANYFVQQLDMVGKNLKTKQASFHRQFIERRYKQNIEEMTQAENRLKAFQEKYNMIALDEQTKAAIETAALLKGQVLAAEVQLGVMQATLSPTHPEITRIKKEIAELNAKLKELDFGTTLPSEASRNLFPAFADVPELGIQLLRLQRDVEIQNTLFTFITQQYEEAKIQEAKDTPTLQVLDKAVQPIRKYRPRRMLLVATLVLLTFMVHVMRIIMSENSKVNSL